MTPASPHPELVGSAAHVFVEDLDSLELVELDAHHLARTLRLRVGEEVSASDGAGRWRRCIWKGLGGISVRAGTARLEATGPIRCAQAPVPLITVGFAVTKGDRATWVVRGLTEVGVDRIQPLVTARSVVRWDEERGAGHVARLGRIAREAAMQSRRVWLPVVGPVATLPELGEDRWAPAADPPAADPPPAGWVGQAALAHPGGGAVSLDRPTILVGPEGGWEASELAGGVPLVGLGGTVLRAETAAIVAGLVLCSLRSGVVREA